jgi:hypothetical protein
MKTVMLSLVAAMTMVAGTTFTHPASAQPGPKASAPGPGPGPGKGYGRGGRWGADYTPGWPMMSEAERNEHRSRMQSAKTYEDCITYRDQHHKQMAERAKERGQAVPGQPRQDACAGMKKP